MNEIKAPGKYKHWEGFNVFLAGSIEMGKAEDWQTQLVKEFENFPITFLNPRRDDWDSSWVQSIDNPQFNEQVNWELTGIEEANHVVFYFDPNTMSPITLMELGYVLGANWSLGKEANVTVCCPDGFWRKGNVEILCARNDVAICSDMQELIYKLKKTYKLWANNYGQPI